MERLGRERWIELLEAAGFVGVRAEVQESSWDFGSRAGFEDWLRANAGSWTQRVGGDQVEELLSDIVDRYEQVAGRAGLFWFDPAAADGGPWRGPDRLRPRRRERSVRAASERTVTSGQPPVSMLTRAASPFLTARPTRSTLSQEAHL